MSTQPKTSSVFTPSSSSSKTVPSHPPAGNQKKDNNQPKALASAGFKAPAIDPVISNNDIFALFSQVKKQMEEQTRTNVNLFREIEELKKGKKSSDDVTPISPRVLNFDTPGSDTAGHYASSSANPPRAAILQHQGSASVPISSSTAQPQAMPFQRSSFQSAQGSFMNAHQGFQVQYPQGPATFNTLGTSSMQPSGISEIHHGDFIPMQAEAATFPTSGNYGTQRMLYPQIGNAINTTSFATNHGNVQNTGINLELAKELQKLKDMISSVPGVVKPIAEMPTGSFRLSRFTSPICDVEIPKRFQTPSMKLYDGTTDPEEHVAHYRERMEINPIPADIKEACLCKGFGSTLTGSALKWLLSIPPNTITSFAHLINLFNN